MNPLEIPRSEGERLEVFGRLRRGRSLDQAYAEMAPVAKTLEARYPRTNAGVLPILEPYTQEFVTRDELVLFYTMFVAVLGVLIIACANVANLLLAQFLIEAVVLSVAEGALGIRVGYAGVSFFNDAMKSATQIPFWIRVDMNSAVWCSPWASRRSPSS